MKSLLLISFSLAMSLSTFAQDNLVQNFGFEDGSLERLGTYKLKGKNNINAWYSPLKKRTAVQYVTPKKSVPVPYDGRATIGLTVGSSKQEKTKFEYITGTLSKPLEAGEVYCVCLNTVLHRSARWAATDFGVLLHKNKDIISDIDEPTSLHGSLYLNDRAPVVNTKWREYCGYFVATGGEQYISIGKFGASNAAKMKDLGYKPYVESSNYQSKAYYLLDNISVIKKDDDTNCGCAEEPVILDEEEAVTQNAHPPYLFALDASGSMKKGGLFDSLRQNLTRFLYEVPNGTPVSFVTFASSSRKIFTGIVNKDTPKKVDSLLQRAPVGGGTKVELGLQLAYESWQPPDPDSAKMILISDGEFHVNPKIVSLIKNEYELRGRKLTLIQIGARASGLQQLKPYMDDYVHTTPSELSQVIAQLESTTRGTHTAMYECGCENTFSDTMNYHFVIDFSGSMSQEKSRAIMAFKYLFEKAPDNAMISITSFNKQSEELFVGKKADASLKELTRMLRREATWGGTDPTPGILHGLKLARKFSHNRYSHLILITDLQAGRISRFMELGDAMKTTAGMIDLSGYAISVDEEGLIATYSEFDNPLKRWVGTSKRKFEKELFETTRSSCDYTSQPYHVNPSKAAAGGQTKRVFGKILKGVVESAVN